MFFNGMEISPRKRLDVRIEERPSAHVVPNKNKM